jgi:hypothetical protein
LPTNFVRLFFISSSGWQVSGIDHCHAHLSNAQMLEQSGHQMVIDGSQTRDTRAPAKLMKHSYIRSAFTMSQMSKATPRPLLRQEANNPIVAVRACQRREQMNPPQLGGTETGSPPDTTTRRKQLIDECIWHVSGNRFQKVRCSNRWQGIAHAPRATLLNTTCRA